MSKLNDLICQFNSDVSPASIVYDWDAGWCYSYIKHTIMQEAQEELNDEDYEAFTLYTDEWLSDNEDTLFHMSDVVGDKLVNQAETLEGEEAKDYARGLIEYLQKYSSDEPKVAELQAFIDKG